MNEKTPTPGTAKLAPLIEAIEALPGERRLVAVAGAPGSGKTTLAARLAAALCDRVEGSAAVLAMDGFHYDDAILEARGDRARKGAPHTFDVGGLTAMLDRLRANQEAAVAVPVFDRRIEIARAGAALIDRRVRAVLVEGNYLLLDRLGWRNLARRFDLTVMLRVPPDELRRRLVARWIDLGFTAEEATRRAQTNDLANAETVARESVIADLFVD